MEKSEIFFAFFQNSFVKTGLLLIFMTGMSHAEIQFPKQADWTDHGVSMQTGITGAWDVRLGGAISPSTVVKKNGIYFLYYIGADGNRSTDGDARHRKLGVATSTDGINFTKYSGNPVITFLPHKGSSREEEEGVFTAWLNRLKFFNRKQGSSWDEEEGVFFGCSDIGRKRKHCPILFWNDSI